MKSTLFAYELDEFLFYSVKKEMWSLKKRKEKDRIETLSKPRGFLQVSGNIKSHFMAFWGNLHDLLSNEKHSIIAL